MVPAQQCLKAGEYLRPEADDRLVEEFEFATLQGAPQVELEPPALRSDPVHGQLEAAYPAAAAALAGVERHVGAAQDEVGIGAIVGREGDADAH